MTPRSILLALVLSSIPVACAGSGAGPGTGSGTPPQDGNKEANKTANKSATPPPPGSGSTGKSLEENHADFTAGCNAKVPGASSYCECGWEQMVKTFSLDEMNSNVDDQPKLMQLRTRTEANCKGKLPEDSLKQSFIKGCSEKSPGLAPYCSCNWTQLRKTFSAAELSDDAIVNTPRFVTAKGESAKACSSSLDENIVRRDFMQGCVKDPKLEAFCGCAWKEMRSDKSAAEIEAGQIDMAVLRPKLDSKCGGLRPH